MKSIRYSYFIFLLFFVVNVISAQTYPYIQGRGSSSSPLSGDLIPAKTGIENTYKLSYSTGTLSSDYKKLVKWSVTNGDIIKKDGTIPSVTVKWNKGVTQGFIKASDVYDADLKRMVEVNSTVTLEDSTTITSAKLSATVSNNIFFIGEAVAIQCSLNHDVYKYVTFGAQGDGFVQGNWNENEKELYGSFTTAGLKTLVVNLYWGYLKISSVTISLLVIPNKIEGPDVVCSGNEEVFTIPNLTTGLSYNWTLTEDVGLYITSGQGTNTVTLRSNSYGNVVLNVDVIYNNSRKKISKNILANTPRIQFVEGRKGDWSPATPFYVGDILYLNAYPEYQPSICTYEWTIEPKMGAYISGSGSTAMVGVNGAGNFIVKCSVKPTCSTRPVTNYVEYRFSAEHRRPYNVLCSSKIIEVSKDKKMTEMTMKNSRVNNLIYELYNAETGRVVKKGLLNVEGGTIDASNISESVYVLKLVQGDSVETYKIMIK